MIEVQQRHGGGCGADAGVARGGNAIAMLQVRQLQSCRQGCLSLQGLAIDAQHANTRAFQMGFLAELTG